MISQDMKLVSNHLMKKTVSEIAQTLEASFASKFCLASNINRLLGLEMY